MQSQDLYQQYSEYFMPVYKPVTFIPDTGIGSKLYDVEGNEVIDFVGGVAAAGLGHAHPELITALEKQIYKLWHVGNIFTHRPQLELAKKLITITKFDKIFLCNSGTEAVEAALKLTKSYAFKRFGKHKFKIVSFYKSFHGRTCLAVSVGGQAKYWSGFEPLPDGIIHGEFNNLPQLDTIIDDEVAAVITEPIQAEGGVIPAKAEFLHKLRTLCDKHNCALIFDEVQTGMGRTGKLFAYMDYQVTPDIIVVAKSLAGGFPIGAMLTKTPFNTGFEFGSHGSTFGGNPLACSVALTTLNIINQPELLTGVIDRHKIMIKNLEEINQDLKIFSEIRGKGLLIGAELCPQYHGKAVEIVEFTPQFGVAVLNASANVIRFLPSLIISFEEIKLGMERLHLALAKFISIN